MVGGEADAGNSSEALDLLRSAVDENEVRKKLGLAWMKSSADCKRH